MTCFRPVLVKKCAFSLGKSGHFASFDIFIDLSSGIFTTLMATYNLHTRRWKQHHHKVINLKRRLFNKFTLSLECLKNNLYPFINTATLEWKWDLSIAHHVYLLIKITYQHISIRSWYPHKCQSLLLHHIDAQMKFTLHFH